jgi:surfactin synthase thioesterase subunit
VPRHWHVDPDVDDDAFVAQVRSATGATTATMPADPELLALVRPALRADFTALAHFAWRATAALPCPITAFRGVDDPVATAADVDAWAMHTADAFVRIDVPGDHFALKQRPGPVRDVVYDTLAAIALETPARRPAP